MSRAVKTLTDQEVKDLLNFIRFEQAGYSSSRSRARNCLIATLMLDAGLRVGEVVQITLSDLVINNAPVTMLHVRDEIAKRKAGRWIPVSQRLKDAIEIAQQWCFIYFQQNPNHFAFTTTTRRQVLTIRQVQRIISAAGQTALSRKIHPHMLRHTFASRLMRVTNSRVVQELLGHKNLSSTQIYTHPNNTDLTNAINQLG